jgi:hypothetical protein
LSQPINSSTFNPSPSVRLFARLCPHVHTGTDRKALVDLLVNDERQATLTFDSKGIDERTSGVFKLIGDGFPNRVFDSAYSMTVDDFKALWSLACRKVGDAAEDGNFFDNDGTDSDSIGD